MNGATLERDFPVSYCARCKRDVLLHFHVRDDGEAERLCLHCDAAIDPEEVRWVGEAGLEQLGYGVREGGGGCGRPDCGNGRCHSG